MKVGFAGRQFLGNDIRNARQTLMQARAHGLDGFCFPSPLLLSPTLDVGELRAVRDCADALGLYLEVGLGWVYPGRFAESPEIQALGDGDYRLGMERMIRACRAIDCVDLWVCSGGERPSPSVPWPDQLRAVQGVLQSLAPLARDLGCHLNLETHEDVTTFEILRLVEAVGPDVLGVTLDIANVVVRVEDPIAATRRVAPYVRQTHLEDVIISFAADGLARNLRPCGEGIINWATVLTILAQYTSDLNLSIEHHRGQFGMPIFRPEWLALHPDLTVAELAEVVRLATVGATGIARSISQRAEQMRGPIATEERADRLRRGVDYLRDLLRNTPVRGSSSV